MQIQSLAKTQHVAYDGQDAGEGLSIFISQPPTAFCRWRLTVKAITDQNVYTAGEIFIAPPRASLPQGRPSRLVGGAVAPGVKSWGVDLLCLGDDTGLIPEEELDITLVSSKCCSAPIGIYRVSERYGYASGPGIAFNLKPGQKLKSWTATAGAAVGAVSLNGGVGVVIPVNTTITARPDIVIPSLQVLSFTGAGLSWFVELLESA